MAKNTSKKIKELKGIQDIKPETITDEHLKDLQALVKDINIMHHQIGVAEAKKHNMIHTMAENQGKLLDMQEMFKKEYGTTDVDITNGSINYEEENGEVNKKD
tara:strand:- start:124 stop:432 length:309 start_codon:yes stop_codon:yes gene_type:complete